MAPGEFSMNFVVFETERLSVREFNIDDIDAVFLYSGDAENTAFMEWGPEEYDGTRDFIHSRLKHQISFPRLIYDFAVCVKESGTLIGSVGLYLNEDLTQGELGYIVNKAYWNHGYAAEAARGMLDFGFMKLELHRIYAKCDSENLASENVMRNAGLRKEGEARYNCFTRVRGREQWRSTKYYAMLQKEYLNRIFELQLRT